MNENNANGNLNNRENNRSRTGNDPHPSTPLFNLASQDLETTFARSLEILERYEQPEQPEQPR